MLSAVYRPRHGCASATRSGIAAGICTWRRRPQECAFRIRSGECRSDRCCFMIAGGTAQSVRRPSSRSHFNPNTPGHREHNQQRRCQHRLSQYPRYAPRSTPNFQCCACQVWHRDTLPDQPWLARGWLTRGQLRLSLCGSSISGLVNYPSRHSGKPPRSCAIACLPAQHQALRSP